MFWMQNAMYLQGDVPNDPSPPVRGNNLLLEDGDKILLEDGNNLLLEG